MVLTGPWPYGSVQMSREILTWTAIFIPSIIETDGAFAPKWLKSASSMLLVLEEPVMPQDGVTFVTICYPLNPLPSLWQMTSYVNKYLVLSWNIHQLKLPRIGSIGAGSLIDRLTYMAPCIKRYRYISRPWPVLEMTKRPSANGWVVSYVLCYAFLNLIKSFNPRELRVIVLITNTSHVLLIQSIQPSSNNVLLSKTWRE